MLEKKRSPRFETVRSWYEKGLWTAQMVGNAIGKWITEEESKEIIEEDN